MSDDEHSDSSSESENVSVTGLIATRAKRVTAGNLYATLRANLDDEELQKELLAEDEEGDAGDYEGSDKDGDDDEALESSSEDEDAGPPKEGDPDDLEGEKALKRQERAEARKKRKVHDARLKLPAWRKKQEKRVKLADDVKIEDGGSTWERPKKKSERANWLPTPADAPTRQSGRAHAVANREIVHANLKESAARSEKQRRVMKNAAEREKSTRRIEGLGQEERLKKCEKIERETAREFGRWEREEAERQRMREEALAAKRKRGVDGPVITHWSGSVLWVGDKIRIRRISHGSKKVEEFVEDVAPKTTAEANEVDGLKELDVPKINADAATDTVVKASDDHQKASDNLQALTHPTSAANALSQSTAESEPRRSEAESQPQPSSASVTIEETVIPHQFSQPQMSQEHSASPDPATSAPLVNPNAANCYTPSAPTLHTLQPQRPFLLNPSTSNTLPAAHPPIAVGNPHVWPPGAHQFALHPAHPPAPPPPPPAPLVREQARRSLVVLQHFNSLDAPTKRSNKAKDPSLLETDPVKSVLVPGSYPRFTPDQARYLLAKPKKRGPDLLLAAPPSRPRCALTSWSAKFRDPRTDLVYADMHQYKAIQRLLAGGCQWSGVLGTWVGPAYGAMGRPAKGVPEGFTGNAMAAARAEVKTEAAAAGG